MREYTKLDEKRDLIEGTIHRALFDAALQHISAMGHLENDISRLKKELENKERLLKNHREEHDIIGEILKEGYYMEGNGLKEKEKKKEIKNESKQQKKERKKRVTGARKIATKYIKDNIIKETSGFLSYANITENTTASRSSVVRASKELVKRHPRTFILTKNLRMYRSPKGIAIKKVWNEHNRQS